MSGTGYLSRLRGARGTLLLCVLALVVFPAAAALILIGLVGIVLLFAGLFSWLHPVDLAAAWGRTLAGLGLIGGSVALAALGWLAIAAILHRETPMHRTLKFVAVLGILLALICLPFGAAIRASAHESWLGGTSWFSDEESGDSGRLVTRRLSLKAGDRLQPRGAPWLPPGSPAPASGA